MRVKNILADPAWFPDRIDPVGQLIRLVRTDLATLRASTFLDGRAPIANGSAPDRVVSLTAFLAAYREPPPPMRWLFHEGFCGSTLMARLVDSADHVLCLREPQILVDLAIWRTSLLPQDAALFRATRTAVLAKLAQRWSPDEAIVVKPTNWINPAISTFWAPERGDRVVLIGTDPATFLTAILRGGRDRIAFVLRLYERFAFTWPSLTRSIEAAVSTSADAMTRAAQLIVATHWLQQVVLAGQEIAGGRSAGRLQFPGFLANPARTLATVDAALALTRTDAGISASMDRTRFHAKRPEAPAPGEEERIANARVREVHAFPIEAALTLRRALDTLGDESMDAVARVMSTMTPPSPDGIAVTRSRVP